MTLKGVQGWLCLGNQPYSSNKCVTEARVRPREEKLGS
jgi:hypothetical protein